MNTLKQDVDEAINVNNARRYFHVEETGHIPLDTPSIISMYIYMYIYINISIRPHPNSRNTSCHLEAIVCMPARACARRQHHGLTEKSPVSATKLAEEPQGDGAVVKGRRPEIIAKSVHHICQHLRDKIVLISIVLHGARTIPFRR